MSFLSDLEMKYRSVPFWSWNDKLEPEVLRAQIREMYEQGIGGFFMHARGGLQTEYLSPEWFECVNACLDEAGKLGMEAWLYDENGWPSGFGCGRVNGLGLAYQQKYLRYEIAEAKALGTENTIACYTPDGDFISREIPQDHPGPVLRCFFEVNSYYVDNLDPKVVRAFLDSTHELYERNIRPELKKYLKGVFTDEPQLSRKGLLWSFIMEEEYTKAYRRDLLKELPFLFLDGAASRGVRVRFWKLAARLFRDNFMKQIHDWCSAHGWLLTGHHVLEETCQSQLSANGAIMPQYRYYDIPGIDKLGREAPSPVMLNQVASMAAQFGKKQILTESFACTGWNINFSGMRLVYNYQLAHGINLLCQHLQGYSLRGMRKRDYPSSNFVHQPWWKDAGRINREFARAGKMLAAGEGHVDVVIVHPMSSAWGLYTGDNGSALIAAYSSSLEKLTRELEALQVNHHYADELTTDECGSVRDGRLVIGECSYRIVLIPAVSNLSRNVTDLLRRFASSGGIVMKLFNSIEPDVFTIDGEPADDKSAAWFRSLETYSDEAVLAGKTSSLIEGRIKVTENGIPSRRVVGTSRSYEDERYYFICSQAADQELRVRLSIPASGRYIEAVAGDTGEYAALDHAERKNGYFSFDFTFGPAESLMLCVSDSLHGERKTDLADFRLPKTAKKLSGQFTLEGMDQGNILVIDRCRYRVDGGEWISDEIGVIHPRLLKLARPCDLEMECTFRIDEDFDLSTPLTLILETPERFSVSLNGCRVDSTSRGTLFDQAFHRIALPAALKYGVNTLCLKTRFYQPESVYECLERARKFESEYNKLVFDSEIENVYLLGDFSVRCSGRREPLSRNAVRLHGDFSLGASPLEKSLDTTGLIDGGLPFFAGKLRLNREFELTGDEAEKFRLLRFTLKSVNSARVFINGRETGFTFSAGTNAVSAAGLLKPGKNTLSVELTLSLRNMLGPFHLPEGESYWIGTRSFTREDVLGAEKPYDPNYSVICFAIRDFEFTR